jgi:FdrA protein
MLSLFRVVPQRYLDSIALLEVASRLRAHGGVAKATAALGTRDAIDAASVDGFAVPSVSPADLFLSVIARDEASAIEALDGAEAFLEQLASRASVGGAVSGDVSSPVVRSPVVSSPGVSSLAGVMPGADLALVSVPGRFAAAEARKALQLGSHVMLFSDNVSVEDEVELKHLAASSGLLLMGPDCGTAMLDGVPLGFANVVERGNVAVVGSSGTGMQEVICALSMHGMGISQAIGCGGRDLSEEVGGATMTHALRLLASDPATKAIIVVGKPASDQSLAHIAEAIRECVDAGKRVIVSLVGLEDDTVFLRAGAETASTLGGSIAVLQSVPPQRVAVLPVQRNARPRFDLAYCGGTLLAEATTICSRAGIDFTEDEKADGNRAIDFGDDVFTVGRPHPMIDPTRRNQFVADAVGDPETAVVLVDVILGVGGVSDPVTPLLHAIDVGRAHAVTNGHDSAPVVAHVCGTELDPFPRHRAIERLQSGGVHVGASHEHAVRSAILASGQGVFL